MHCQDPSACESTAPHQHGQAGAATPQPAETLPFTDAACSNSGGLALGTVKLGNTNDTLRYFTLAQLL